MQQSGQAARTVHVEYRTRQLLSPQTDLFQPVGNLLARCGGAVVFPDLLRGAAPFPLAASGVLENLSHQMAQMIDRWIRPQMPAHVWAHRQRNRDQVAVDQVAV